MTYTGIGGRPVTVADTVSKHVAVSQMPATRSAKAAAACSSASCPGAG
jgi:hypothetical protein